MKKYSFAFKKMEKKNSEGINDLWNSILNLSKTEEEKQLRENITSDVQNHFSKEKSG